MEIKVIDIQKFSKNKQFLEFAIMGTSVYGDHDNWYSKCIA